mmetsp:Transcript_31243/g.100889  ORF Transcript_31243/g.100889 Transcript_31243/m.100889 type:complete len:358 (+) Transcript_31243:196-1269(+)
MIAPARPPRRTPAIALLAVAFIGAYALSASIVDAGRNRSVWSNFKALFKEAPRTPLVNATPSTELLELPDGCKIRGGVLVSLLNTVVDHALTASKMPTPPDPSMERKMLVAATGSSMVMYNKSVMSVNVGHIEIATCWIPGPKGNVLLPDFLAVHVTRVTGRMRMKYYLEQNLFGLSSQAVGGGDMEVSVTGFLRLDMIDLHDFNSTVKGCTGRMGVQEMWANGPHGMEGGNELERADVLNDEQLVQDFCYGPSYWDYSFGPRPPGIVAAINQEVRKLFYKGYIAPPPPPPPPFLCDCSWTEKYACPAATLGAPVPANASAFAADDGSACFGYCCPAPAPEEALEEQVQHHFDMSIF